MEGGVNVRVRPAVKEDLHAISAIEARSFSNPWHPETFRSLLTRERVRILAAEQDGEVIGYAVLWWVLDQGELANLAVHPDFQGLGIGSRLLDRVIADARAANIESLFLEVRTSNERARRLYLRRGFVQISIRKGYYRKPPEDACILLKKLVPASETKPEPDPSVSHHGWLDDSVRNR